MFLASSLSMAMPYSNICKDISLEEQKKTAFRAGRKDFVNGDNNRVTAVDTTMKLILYLTMFGKIEKQCSFNYVRVTTRKMGYKSVLLKNFKLSFLFLS